MNASMERKKDGELVYYTSRTIDIPHMFTTKFGGVSTGHVESLNLGFNRGDERENVLKNYDILAGWFGVEKERLTCTKQVHNDEVGVVTEKEIGMGLGQPNSWQVDALVTNLPGVPLCGFYADCVVTLLYDPVSRSIAACHSGWRGTAKGILKKTVRTMAEQYGAKPENIRAVIGPSIRNCCFETDRDVPDAMREEMGERVNPYIEKRGVKYFPDLQGINTMLLREAGVEQIVDSEICTKCHSDVFWSHRATQGHRGVHAGVIMLPKE